MATPLTCDDVEIGTETLIRSLFVRMDDGSFAIKTVPGEGGEAIDCSMTETSTMEMIRGAIVREGSEFALQVQSVS